MLASMKVNPKMGALGINYKAFSPHIAMGCVMMLSKIVKKIKWKYNQGEPCECNSTMEQVRKAGYEVQFMRDITALDLNYLGSV